MKYGKEFYITKSSNPGLWEQHVNVKTLNEFAQYITGSVLDIGCNHGGTTFWLTKHNVTSITGLDINEEALVHARDNFNEVTIPFKFVSLDLITTCLQETFDTIISFHTLEHIYPEDVNTFISNIYKMLNSNGYVIIGIPYEESYPDVTHVSSFNEQTLTDAMTQNGFVTIECFKEDRFEEKNILTGLFKKQ